MTQHAEANTAASNVDGTIQVSRNHLHSPKYGWFHEVEKRFIGQTPKDTLQATPRQSNVESHLPRPSSGELDREVETNFRRTARYSGVHPHVPRDRAYDPAHGSDGSDASDTSTCVPPSSTLPDSSKSKQGEGNGQEGTNHDRNDGNDNESEQGRPRGNLDEAKDPNQVGWDGPNDPDNPQNWSQRKKWGITLVVSFVTVNVTFGSSAPSSTTQQLAERFNIGNVTATLITSVFLFGYCLGPIIWSTTSEQLGRKIVYSISQLLYMLFILGQALAQNPQTLFITRFISGICAAAPLTVSGGVIADIWDPVGRGSAMSLFSSSVFIGPVLGPIIGGFVVQSYLGWRWVFWVMMIFTALCWVLIMVFLSETFAPILLLRKAKRLRKLDPEGNKDLYAPHERQDWSLRGIASRTFLRPFEILFQEPVLILITIYLSIVYGILYGLFEAVPVIFAEKRGFNLGQSGLVFVAVGLGTTLGGFLNVLLQRHYRVLSPFWHDMPPPEERLWGSMLAGPVLILGAFWLGWTGQYPVVPWYVPALALIPIGMSFTLVFISLLSYVVDCYTVYAASALASNTVIRSAVGGAFPLFIRQELAALGVNWGLSLFGFVAAVLAIFPFFFYMYGSKIRGWSKFAPAFDLKIRNELEEEGKLPQDSLNTTGPFDRNGLQQAKRDAAVNTDPERQQQNE